MTAHAPRKRSIASRILVSLTAEKADKLMLMEAIADFDKHMDALNVVQELVEVKLDGDELLADIETAVGLHDECRKQRWLLLSDHELADSMFSILYK